ncbi:MAG: hypothetical protein AB7U45_10055 [Desulfamplus sp.]
MTKPIKFNLILDGKPIRDLKGLEEHFNIHDLLEHYKSGLLQKWLKVRQLSDFADTVEAITEKDDLKIAEQLVKIFESSLTKEEIGDAVYPLIFREAKEIQLQDYEKKFMNERAVIDRYHQDYRSLCEGLKKSKNDYSFVKHSLKKMANEFYGLYEMNYYALFSDLIKESPLSVFGVLAADKKQQSLRSLLLSNSQIKTSIKDYVDKILVKADTKIFYVNEQVKNEEPKIDDISINDTNINISDVVNAYDISMNDVEAKIPDFIDEFNKTGYIKNLNLYCEECCPFSKELKHIDFKGSEFIAIIGATPPDFGNIKLSGSIFTKKNPVYNKILRYNYKLHYLTVNDIKDYIAKINQKELERQRLQQKKIKGKELEQQRLQQKKIKEKKLEQQRLQQKKATPSIPKDLPPYIKTFSGHTESYWKDLESAGKEYMIIYMEEGNFVRNMGIKGEELSAADVNGSFPILNGIDYKSNYDSHTLYYMEV